ncbi:uncharacterized protein LOC141695336 [Apium graveolens]|uniref:uncharacterized protein LOC141695336 n=1 Tax=Apium graveolens TaxID=4045 RepID=UPI003D78E94B
MVISWLHNSVYDTIKRSILFINYAFEIWKQLEKRFMLTNGSRKYKLTRGLFVVKQNGMSVTEYFTALSSIWEELESMNILPSVKSTTAEVTALLKAIETLKEEAKLFQFLNGLDECFGPQRSQLLKVSPLPTVESACASIQQEESQRDALCLTKTPDMEASVMFTRSSSDRFNVCTACGGKGHVADKCWTVLGYPRWHYKYNGHYSGSTTKSARWNNNKPPGKPRMANVVQGSVDGETSPVMFSQQQLEQLFKMLPGSSLNNSENIEDSPFSGMINTNKMYVKSNEWIVDYEASDHMTSSLNNLLNVKHAPPNFTINLPTGATSKISHIGDVILKSGLKLLNVLYVPQFTHNLLSINKLAKNNACDVIFYPGKCLILDRMTKQMK